MELSGSFFEYSGVSSRKYNLVFANVNTDRFVALVGDISPITVFNRKANRNYFIGETFDDSPVRFDAEIVTDDTNSIERQTRKEIEKWLFHQPDYRRLYIDTACDVPGESSELVNGETKRLYLNCRLVNPERIEGNGGVIGYRFVVECDSCMAWQDEVTYTYALDNTNAESSSIISVPVDTDLNDYVYPKVTIQVGSTGGDITIINHTDDDSRLTSFIGLSPAVSVVMKGDGINYISGNNFLKFSNKNFIRLLDGDNNISVVGDVSGLTFEFQNRRYL